MILEAKIVTEALHNTTEQQRVFFGWNYLWLKVFQTSLILFPFVLDDKSKNETMKYT